MNKPKNQHSVSASIIACGSASEAALAEVLSLNRSRQIPRPPSVNTELVTLYWQVGAYISQKLASAEWGDGFVEELARAIVQLSRPVRLYAPEPVPHAPALRDLLRLSQIQDLTPISVCDLPAR